MIRMNCRVLGIAFLTTILAAWPQNAKAGFEWTAPPAPTSPAGDSALPALTPEMPAIPATEVDSATLDQMENAEPVMPAAEPMPAISHEPVATRTIRRARPPVAQGMAAPMTTPASTIPVPPPSKYAEVQGFGSDMPLAFAMRQIVPPEYAFAFDPSVDHGARVSWNGGQPWDMVLTETLLPLGLASVIDGNTVRVVPAGAAPAQMPVMQSAQVPAFTPAQPMAPYQGAAPAAPPVNMLAPDPAPVREVYIARERPEKRTADSKPKKEKSFWSRLGFEKEEGWKKAPALTPGDTSSYQEISPQSGPVTDELSGDPDIAQPEPVTAIAEESAFSQHEAYMETSLAKPADQPVPLMDSIEPVAQPVSAPAFVPPAETQPAPAEQAKAQLPVDLYEIRYWQGEKGDSLHNVLKDWSQTSHVELYWGPDEDYVLPEAVRLHGSYTDAVTRLLSIYEDDSDRPLGRLHPNLPYGPSVLVIEEYQG